MLQSFKVTGVRVIIREVNPCVVFEVANARGVKADSIVRGMKQSLIDLQNSGRALRLPADLFDVHPLKVSLFKKEMFINACNDCIGAIVTGDITPMKAGGHYVIKAGHPALTNPAHPLSGITEGTEVLIEKDSSPYVDGFLSLPLTEKEKTRRDMILMEVAMRIELEEENFGFGSSAETSTGNVEGDFIGDGIEDEFAGAIHEGFGDNLSNDEKGVATDAVNILRYEEQESKKAKAKATTK